MKIENNQVQVKTESMKIARVASLSPNPSKVSLKILPDWTLDKDLESPGLLNEVRQESISTTQASLRSETLKVTGKSLPSPTNTSPTAPIKKNAVTISAKYVPEATKPAPPPLPDKADEKGRQSKIPISSEKLMRAKPQLPKEAPGPSIQEVAAVKLATDITTVLVSHPPPLITPRPKTPTRSQVVKPKPGSPLNRNSSKKSKGAFNTLYIHPSRVNSDDSIEELEKNMIPPKKSRSINGSSIYLIHLLLIVKYMLFLNM
jgi:hypothetical protein